jgi:subfamily B ATP-binding cassette protein MsbA
MKHFLRAIKLSLANKWTIALLMVNSLLIGVLWGGSITAVYPFVEVVFAGKTIETWLDEEVEKSKQVIKECSGQLQQIEAEIAEVGRSLELRSQRSNCQKRIEAEKKANRLLSSILPYIRGRAPQTPFGTLVLVMGLLIVLTTIKGACLVLNTVLVSRIANRTGLVMRRQFYSAALRMDQLVIDKKGTAAMMTMLAHNLNLVTAGLTGLYGKGTREPLKMLVCFTIAAWISWKLLLLALLIAPVAALLVNYLSGHMKRAARNELGGVAGVLHATMESISALRVVKIYNRERTEKARFNSYARSLYNLGLKQSFYDSLLRPTTELAGILSLSIAVLASGYLVLNDTTHLLGIRMSDRPLSVSSVFMFFAMLAGVSDPARKMGEIYNSLVRACVASQSLYEFFDREPQVRTPLKPRQAPYHCKSIRFERVNFAYRPNQTILKRLDLEIPFGQTVALIGPNGSGKTTLVNLLARFYDPQLGAVWIDDVNLLRVNPRQIRRQMALVTQDPVLFQGTVYENIQYGNIEATRQQIFAAAELARVADFLELLPEGMQSQVGDRGNSLSGGQRQRIALARAVVADPRILVLDEATSQIDSKSETLIHASMQEFLKDRTTIFISHRESTLELADRIIMLDQGKIVGDLTYAEYRQMHRWQPPFRRAA